MSVKIELWNDTGYTESGVERPPIGSTLPEPDHVFTDLNPQRNELFSSVQIKVPYTDIYRSSYLRATYDFNESDPIVIYGWIDAVALVSDTDRFPNTEVIWHVDLWRTYARNAVFRTGTVHRRPAGGDMPPQPYPFRYKMVDSRQTLIPYAPGFAGDKLMWVYMNFIEEFDQSQTTQIRHVCWPVLSGGGAAYIAISQGAASHQGPSFNHVYSGLVDEDLGLAPSAIIACTVSPVAPFEYTGNGYDSNSPIVVSGSPAWAILPKGDVYVFEVSRVPTASNFYTEFSSTLPSSVITTDVDEYAVTGLDGAIAGTLPWGISVKDYTYRMIDDTSSFYIQIRFDGVDSSPEGLSFTIPLPLLAVTQNSWSDYVYSGQREYDINMRRLQTAQEMVNGLTGGVTTGINTWQMQSITNMGRRKPESSVAPDGTNYPNYRNRAFNAGLAKSAALTGLTGGAMVMASGAIQAGVSLWFNDEYQKWEDYRHAHQIDNIVTSGAGTDNIFYGAPISLVLLKNDAYSTLQRDTDIELYGCHVTEPMSSCQALINAGGPLQITNLTVGGAIPVEAKEYIREMFSNGVRLV